MAELIPHRPDVVANLQRVRRGCAAQKARGQSCTPRVTRRGWALDLAAGAVEMERDGLNINEFLQGVPEPAVDAAGDAAQSGAPLTPELLCFRTWP